MNRIKLLRIEKKMSQEAVAAQLNTTQASISKYELGRASPDVDIVVGIAEFFDVSVEYLLGLSPFRKSGPSEELRKEEIELLSLYDSLSEEQKKQSYDFMLNLSRSKAGKPKTQK